jgi:hypothetical protein
MTKDIIISQKYTCLFYSEGKEDKDFLYALSELNQFKYYAKNWNPSFGHASGCSPRDILDQCLRESRGIAYDLIICFIDLDKLKSDCRKSDWKLEKEKLETEFSVFGIKIIWHEDNLEDEYRKVLGEDYARYGKHHLNQVAKKSASRFLNSEYWNRIKQEIKNKEFQLESKAAETS